MPRKSPATPAGRRRMPAEERTAELRDRAAAAFAEHGFSLSTREIAARSGVTQALLYKYFGSKAALIEAVLESRFLAGRAPTDPSLLSGPAPLEDRVAAFYAAFVEGGSAVNVRLFLRAALDGLDLPSRYGARLDARVLRPVLDALRAELGAPPSAAGPLPPAERELAMMLHGCVVFTMIRREVHGARFEAGHAALIRAHARVWTPGALDRMRRLLAAAPPSSPGVDTGGDGG